ncbi:MAG: DJ-1/PfpI family protein [Pyrinomonadaceae bacterium]
MKQVHLIVAIILVSLGFGMFLPVRAQEKNAAPAEGKKPGQRNLAILLFEGVQIIDYTGPFETFGHVYNDDGPAFNIYTIAEKSAPITTAMGMSVNPKYTFENAPEPDVLMIPGGGVRQHLDNAVVIKWIQDKSRSAEIVLSVCNGAFFLAKAGLLDGLEATTTAGLIPDLRAMATKTRVVDDRRFVDNGKIITAAGLSSGIDGALHVIERLFGRGTAQMSALGMEYNWNPESKYARAALADKFLRFDYDVKVVAGGWKPLSREGDRTWWENRWLVTTESTPTEVMDQINATLAAGKTYDNSSNIKWTRVDATAHSNGLQSSWLFADEKGANWSGTARIETVAGEKNRFMLSVKVVRAEARPAAK